MKLKLILLNILLSLSSLAYPMSDKETLEIISPFQEFTITLNATNYNVLKKNINLLPIHFTYLKKKGESTENGEYKIKFHCTKNQLTYEEIDQEFQGIHVDCKEIKPEGYKKSQLSKKYQDIVYIKKFVLQFKDKKDSKVFMKMFDNKKFSNIKRTPRYVGMLNGQKSIDIDLTFDDNKSLKDVILFLNKEKIYINVKNIYYRYMEI